MKKILALILCALCANAAPAVEKVRLQTVKLDGTKTSQTVALEKTADGAMRLRVPVSKISRDVNFIEVFAGEACAQKGDDGYWVLGDGRLGHFIRENGSIKNRRNPLPLYGVKKGGKAFVAIVKGLKYEFEVMVEAADGAYKIYPRFLINEIVFAPYEDIIIDFYSLEGENANYSGMGRVYRKYQLDRGEVEPLRERVKKYPTLAYSAETMFFRVKHGSKAGGPEQQTDENLPDMHVYYTFDDFANFARQLKSLGVEKLEMCFVGWQKGGFDSSLPDMFPVEPAFGGEAKMREAIKTAQSLGYQTVCHVCNTDFYRYAKRFDEFAIAKLPDGNIRPYAHMAGGRAYNPCFRIVNDYYIDDDYKALAALGLKGNHHIDVTSCIVPYACFDPRHPCNRQQTADYMNAIGMKCRKYFGGFGSEGPCDHVAKTLDYALYVWAYPHWVGPDSPLVDRLAPIWQIVYHGIILSNPYYATIDYTYEGDGARSWLPYNALCDKTYRRLKMAELNGRPTFYFATYRKHGVKPVKEAYDEYEPMKHLQYEFMDFHGEIAPFVYITKFSNGEYIITNYSDSDFAHNGATVKSRDYKLFKR